MIYISLKLWNQKPLFLIACVNVNSVLWFSTVLIPSRAPTLPAGVHLAQPVKKCKKSVWQSTFLLSFCKILLFPSQNLSFWQSSAKIYLDVGWTNSAIHREFSGVTFLSDRLGFTKYGNVFKNISAWLHIMWMFQRIGKKSKCFKSHFNPLRINIPI